MQSSASEPPVKRQPPPRTTLVLLAGVAGSGKSTIARGLLDYLHAVYLDNNFIADAFFPNTRRGLEYRRLRPRMYRALYRITGENLSVGNSVLLDAPHVRQSRSALWYHSMLSLTRGTAAELVMIKCVASEPEIRRRLEARGGAERSVEAAELGSSRSIAAGRQGAAARPPEFADGAIH